MAISLEELLLVQLWAVLLLCPEALQFEQSLDFSAGVRLKTGISPPAALSSSYSGISFLT